MAKPQLRLEYLDLPPGIAQSKFKIEVLTKYLKFRATMQGFLLRIRACLMKVFLHKEKTANKHFP